MKKLTSLLIATVISGSTFAQTDFRSDWEKMELAGAVKSIEESVDGSKTNNYTFDNHGYLTSNGMHYSYDSNGRMMTAYDDVNKYSFDYNSKGQLIEFDRRTTGQNAYKEAYVYDTNGNMTSCNTSNSMIAMFYDESNRLIHTNDVYGKILREVSYDEKGRISVDRTIDTKTVYTYDSKDRIVKKEVESKGKKVGEEISYDNNNAVTKRIVTTQTQTSKEVETHTYTIDETGNWKKDVVQTESNGKTTTKTITRAIEYQALSRQLYLIK